MSWTNAAVTEAGLALQAKLVDGQTLGFLRVAAGTGTVDPSVLANQTALANEKQTLTFQPPNVLDGAKIKVPVMLNNIGLETGYTMQQLGFFADDPDNGEILYAIVQDEVGDTVPSQTESPGFVIEWTFVFQYGNADSVTVTLDPVGLVSIGMVGRPGGVAALGDNGAVPVSQGGTGATTAPAALTALGAMRADATGEDIPVSKTDGTTIHAALENKLSITDHGSNNTSLQDTLLSDGIHICSNWADCPSGLADAKGICMVSTFINWVESGKYWGYRIYLPINDQGIYINRCANSVWQGWESLATATSPQVRNLTLQSGFSANGDCTFFVTQVRNLTLQSGFSANGDCTFFVTQESTVHLAGGVSGTLPANQDTQIGTLQADVRPAYQCRRPAVTNAGTAYIDIHTDGTVWVHPFAAASECWFDTSFVAGGAQ